METVTKNTNDKIKVKPSVDYISKQEVAIIVKRALGSAVKVLDYHVSPYSKEKLGFMGAHCHLAVTVQRKDSTEQLSHTFFLKAIPYNIKEQASVIEDSKIFFKETNFYKRILPELLSSVKNKSWVAQCYLVNVSAMVFEDLKSRNFVLKDKLLDVPSLKSGLTALANMHVASMLAEKRLGTTFVKLYPAILEEAVFVQKGRFHTWFRHGVKVVEAVAKSIGLDHSRITETCELIFAALVVSDRRRNVVLHGDPWSFNMMFDDSKPLAKAVLVDFQILRYGPPTSDVVQLFYLAMRREFREKNEKDLLRFYHEALCAALRENDQDVSLPTLEDILQEYEEIRIVGLVTGAMYYPIMFVEANLCADITKDSDGFSKLLFLDRVDLVFNMMQKDPAYKEIVVEIVTELVQRSKKYLSY